MRIEDDPQFLAWLEEWFSGAITIATLQLRYQELLVSRQSRTALSVRPIYNGVSGEFLVVNDFKLPKEGASARTVEVISEAWLNDLQDDRT